MGFFRFRRSIKLFPGVRWNIGKKSSSLSFGGKGAHYTVGGPRGSRTTVGIPGTGLSYTETSGTSPRSPQENSGCAGCLGQIILFLIVVGGISMCVNSGKETPADKKSTTTPTPQATPTPTPTPQPTPAPTAIPLPFPEPLLAQKSAIAQDGRVHGIRFRRHCPEYSLCRNHPSSSPLRGPSECGGPDE